MASSPKSPIKILAFVAVLAATVQGLFVLHGLLVHPASRRATAHAPYTRSTQPAHIAIRDGAIARAPEVSQEKGPASGAHAATSGQPGPTADLSEYLDPPPDRSPEAMLRFVRSFYNAKGVYDEDYIRMVALDESDNAYKDALAKAAALRDEGKAREAVDALQEALAGLDSHHLMARLRLQDALCDTALEAGDLSLTARTRQEMRDTRDAVIQLLSRAGGPSGGFDSTTRQQFVEGNNRQYDMEQKVIELVAKLSPDGDPSRLPDHLRALWQQAAERR